MPKKYPAEVRKRAVRMTLDRLKETNKILKAAASFFARELAPRNRP
jgi:transposase-like protein